MNPPIPLLLGLLLLATPAAAAGPPASGVPVTRWPAEMDPRPVTPAEWAARHGDRGPLQRTLLRQVDAGAGERSERGLVAVLVESSLAGALAGALDTHAADLADEGYDVRVESLAGGDAAELRGLLSGLAAEDDLAGALLLGALPLAWFEIEDDHGEYGHAAFPCDLMFMDLDGSWLDDDGDGVADRHEDGGGDTEPEIWIGRLLATEDMGDEAELLGDYLARAHAFRRGEIVPDRSALVYVDDDWAEWTDWYVDELIGAFPQVTWEDAVDVTAADDYAGRLTGGFDNVALYVHSSPDAHFFVRHGVYDTLTYAQIPPVADALFYNLFACAAANYADHAYMAGTYVLETGDGLLAVGSTKTGSMLQADGYYDSLAGFATFGDAFRGWLAGLAPYDFGEICWSYGMTLIGDPTLRIGYPTLEVSPHELQLDTRELDPLEVAIQVDNGGLDDLVWDAAVTEDWMVISPEAGGAGDELVLTVDPAGLGLGSHGGAVRLEAPGATNHPLEVPVELAVLEPAQVCVDPDPIEAYLVRGDGEAEIEVSVSNCREGRMAWTAVASEDWVELAEPAGEVREGAAAVPVRFTVPGPRDGRHPATIAFETPDGEGRVVDVALRVGPAGCKGCAVGGGGGWGPARVAGGLAGLALAAFLRRRWRS